MTRGLVGVQVAKLNPVNRKDGTPTGKYSCRLQDMTDSVPAILASEVMHRT